MRISMLALHSPRDLLVLDSEDTRERVDVALKAVEQKATKLRVMTSDVPSGRAWIKFKDRLRRFMDVSVAYANPLDEKRRLDRGIDKIGTMLLREIRRRFSNDHAELFHFFHAFRLLLAVTNSNGEIPQALRTEFVEYSFHLPLDYFSEKYANSLERARSLLADEADVTKIFREVDWQFHSFLDEFSSPKDERNRISVAGKTKSAPMALIIGGEVQYDLASLLSMIGRDDSTLLVGHFAYFLFIVVMLPVLGLERSNLMRERGPTIRAALEIIRECISRLRVASSSWNECNKRLVRYLDVEVSIPDVYYEKRQIDGDLRSLADSVSHHIRCNYSEMHSDLMFFVFILKRLAVATMSDVGLCGMATEVAKYVEISCTVSPKYFSAEFVESVEQLRACIVEAEVMFFSQEQIARIEEGVMWQIGNFLEEFRRPGGEEEVEEKLEILSSGVENEEEKEEKTDLLKDLLFKGDEKEKVDLPKEVLSGEEDEKEEADIETESDNEKESNSTRLKVAIIRPLVSKKEEEEEEKEFEEKVETVDECCSLISKLEGMENKANQLFETLRGECSELQTAVKDCEVSFLIKPLNEALGDKRAQLERATKEYASLVARRRDVEAKRDNLATGAIKISDIDCNMLANVLQSIVKCHVHDFSSLTKMRDDVASL